MTTVRKFALSLAQALEDYEVRTTGLDQRDLLPVAVILADRLVGLLPRVLRKPRPTLYVAGMDKYRNRKSVFKHLQHVRSQNGGCMVDIYVCKGKRDPYRTVLTIEAEGFPGYSVGVRDTSDSCDYLWDLFKLLQVPSPIRVFLAMTTVRNVAPLEQLMDWHVGQYRSNRRPRDLVFGAVIPFARLSRHVINVYRWKGAQRRQFVLKPVRQV